MKFHKIYLRHPVRIPLGAGFYRRIRGYGMYSAAESYIPKPTPFPRSYLNRDRTRGSEYSLGLWLMNQRHFGFRVFEYPVRDPYPSCFDRDRPHVGAGSYLRF